MKAMELRIGNYVYFHTEGDLRASVTVLGVSGGINIELIDQEEMLSTEQEDCENFITPIPLTEEWLLKFGFVKDEEYLNRGAHCNYFTGLMRFKYCGSLGVWQFDVGTYEDLTMIKYVHQLQNLYFALTGEELEISDDKTKK